MIKKIQLYKKNWTYVKTATQIKVEIIPFGPSLFVLGHFFLLGVGLGFSMRWAGIVKFFDPTIAP